MAYVNPNFKTKKALKDAVANGKYVSVFYPGIQGEDLSKGIHSIAIEGPHYPEPHKWYASVTIVDGKVIKVR